MGKAPLFVRPPTDAERAALEDGLRSFDAFVLRRAQIILASAQGDQVGVIASLSLDKLAAVASDRSNAAEGKPGAIALGRALFNDPRFSRDGSGRASS